MRKVIYVIVGFLVVLIIAAAVIPQFLNVNRYRGRIQAELEQRLNRPVSLGDMHASLLPPSFKVSNAVIGEDKAFGTGHPFATAEQLTISLQFWPLLRGNFKVNSIALTRPKVEMVRNTQGMWNFASLGNRTVAGATTPAKPQTKPASEQRFSLAALKLTDGTVAITDYEKHQSRAVYDHIDLSLQDFAPGKPFKLDLAAHLPGQGKQVIKLTGRGGPIDDASMISTPFDGKITLNEVSVSGVQKFLNSAALADMNATLTGEATVKNAAGKLSSKGSLKAENAVVRGHQIGYPVQVDYDVADDLNNDVIQISQANVKLGNTPLSLSGSVNTRNTPALLDLSLKAADVSIAELARLAGAFGYAFNPNMQVAGRLRADLHAQGSPQNPVLNGNVSASDLVVSGKDLPQPVRVPAIQLALTPDSIRSGNFTASTGGTNVTGRFELRQYASSSPIVNTTLQIPETELGDVLNIAHGLGVTALEGVSGNGRFALNVTANGPVKNMNAMVFNGNGSLRNATVRTPALTQPLTIQNAALTFSQNGVAINGFAGAIASTHANGQLSVRNFDAPQVSMALNADKVNVLELQKLVAENPKPKANSPSLLSKATGGGTVSIGTLTYDQLALTNVHSTVTLDRGIIKLAPISATVAGGQSTGSITIDTRGPQSQYTVAMNAQKVDANKLLSSVSKVRYTLFGLLTSNINAQFRSVPNGQDIAGTLNGKVALNLTDGKLANVDFLQQVGSVAGFQSLGRAAQGMTKLQKVTGNFDIQNGVARTNDLRADVEGGTIAATGALSLVDNGINMKVIAVLNNAYSQQVGGSQIGGFMKTALANSKGEIVVPVLVTGTLQAPKVAPDMQAVAQMKLQNMLPTLQNPGALSNVLGGVLGGKKQTNGTQPQNPVGAILGGLAGQQQQQQPAQGNQPNQAQQQQQQQQKKGTAGAITDAINSLFGGKKQPQQQQQSPPPQ